MTPAVLADLVRSCADQALTRRGVDPTVLPATVTVQRPCNPQHGDYATTVALQTASKIGVPPRELAHWLVQELAVHPGVHSAEVAGPGYINLRLTASLHREIIRQVLADGEHWDRWHPHPRMSGPGMPSPAQEHDLVTLDLAAWPAARRVQYAHARLASLARNAIELGITAEGAPLELLEHEQEGELVCMLGEFPRVVALATGSAEPRRLASYLEQLAGTYHDFVERWRVLPMGDEEPGPRHAARLALCLATRRVLARGLGLLGLSAPEQM